MDTLRKEPSPEPLPDEIIAIKEALARQAVKPLGGDVRSAAFAKAMLYLIDGVSHKEEMHSIEPVIDGPLNEPVFKDVLVDILHTRSLRLPGGHEPFTPSPFIGLIMRCVQADRLESQTADNNLAYPNDYKAADAWLITIKNMLADTERAEKFYLRAYAFDLLSNVPQRGAALELGARALQANGALPEQPVIDHVGCSQQEIEKKIAQKDRYPYKPIEAMEGDRPSPALTRRINEQLTRRWLPRMQIGFDINNKDDPVIAAFAKACSFYPSELLDAARVKEYEALARANPKNVHFVCGDFLSQTPETIGNALNMPDVPPADVVFFSFSLYQQTQEQQKAMLEHARRRLTPDGWIFVLDFVRPDATSPTGMRFEEDWSASSYLCRLLAISNRGPHATPQELFVFENGRIERVRLGMGLIAQEGSNFLAPVAAPLPWPHSVS